MNYFYEKQAIVMSLSRISDYVRKGGLLIIASLVFFLRSTAQDTHYWTHKFGPRNTLLSGSDDATSSDNSAIINNPGGIGFNAHNSLSMTTNAYSLDNNKLLDGAGSGLNMSSITPISIPLILSGVFKYPKLSKWSAGYALLDKSHFNFKSSQRFDGLFNVLTDTYSPGMEEFVSQIDIRNNLTEMWAGISVAYRINEHLAVGVSNFLAYRDQSSSYVYTARAIRNNVQQGLDIVSANALLNISYYNVRNILKLGISGRFDKLSAGISITLPSFMLYSNGTVNSDLTGVNVLLDSVQQQRASFVANDRQTNLKAKFKSPASISAGINTALGKKTRLYVTGEFFLGIAPYMVISPKPSAYIRPGNLTVTNSSDFLSVAGGAAPVFNVAVGLQTQLSNRFSFLCGVRTDNSYFTSKADDIGNQISITSCSIYHGTSGVMMKRNKSDIYIGLKGSYGRNRTKQIANINSPSDNFLMTGTIGDTYYRHYSLSALIGYNHYLN